MRLIDADALLQVVMPSDILSDGFRQVFQAMVDGEPTVDAVEVVRCKNCIYWGAEDGVGQTHDGLTYARCRIHHHYLEDMRLGWCPTEEDFCSVGREREDGAG